MVSRKAVDEIVGVLLKEMPAPKAVHLTGELLVRVHGNKSFRDTLHKVRAKLIRAT